MNNMNLGIKLLRFSEDILVNKKASCQTRLFYMAKA